MGSPYGMEIFCKGFIEILYPLLSTKLIQDLRKSTLKALYLGANGIRPHARVVLVGKSCY